MMRRTKIRNLHFVGIGGSGMSGIAEVLLNQGFRVRGSDMKDSQIVRRLTGLGAEIHIGHQADHVRDAEVVVISSAVKEDNVEVQEARRLKIPVIKRAEMLSELMRTKYGIAVAGAHGKTTTTSLVAQVLTNAGLDPTVVIGGRLSTFGSSARLGQSDIMVAEADESDGSFLRLSPAVVVVTNLDAEHLDYYGSLDEIKQAFLEFIDKVPFYGLSVLCLDNPGLQDLIPHVHRRMVTYGLSAQADVRAFDVKQRGPTTSFRVMAGDRDMGPITLNLPGIHNMFNALAAICVGMELDVSFESAAESLQRLGQVQRRLEILGSVDEVMVVDDYAHHPTEIKATLEAVQSSWKERRIVAVFQPHRYSRSFHLHDEFVKSFYQADHLVITEIYPAGEKPIKDVNGHRMFEGIRDHGHRDVLFLENEAEIVEHLVSFCRPGDLLLTMGAGNVYEVGLKFLEQKMENAVRA